MLTVYGVWAPFEINEGTIALHRAMLICLMINSGV